MPRQIVALQLAIVRGDLGKLLTSRHSLRRATNVLAATVMRGRHSLYRWPMGCLYHCGVEGGNKLWFTCFLILILGQYLIYLLLRHVERYTPSLRIYQYTMARDLCFLLAKDLSGPVASTVRGISEEEWLWHIVQHMRGVRHKQDYSPATHTRLWDPVGYAVRKIALNDNYQPLTGSVYTSLSY